MKASKLTVFAAGIALAVSSFANAESSEVAQLRAQLAAQEARIQQLEGNNEQQWLNERRAEEVKALVREVIQDAETRASLLESGMYAGHDGKHFFLKSADGGFLMNISGQIQIRYLYNSRDQGSSSLDEGELGFTIRRAKIGFSGHIADPKLKYAIRLAVDRSSNTALADKIVISYDLSDTLTIWGGEDKAPFLREEATSSSRQLAVERSYVNELFTADYVQGLGLMWHDESVMNDMLKAHVMINDGARSGTGSGGTNAFTQTDDFGAQPSDPAITKDFDDDRTDFAISARVDVRVDGDWAQMKDFTSFPGEEQAIFVGGAIHWEQGETGDTFFNNNFFAWTVDASYENQGLSVFGSLSGMHTDNEASGATDYDIYGFVVQVGYNIATGDDSIEPFARYEFLDLDGATADDTISLLTFGFNYYLTKHNAKFTADVVWAFDPIPLGQSGLGLLTDASGEEDQVVLRTQFQLLF